MRGNMGEFGDILLDDLEGLLREINEYGSGSPEDIPQSLDRYLQFVAKSGNIVFPWQHVRPLFRTKIMQAMEQFPGEACPNSEAFVMERFDMFRAAPFTIQRLTELVIHPTRHYKKKEKFLRGLEKTVLVVSTIEPWSLDMKNGNDSGSDGEMDQAYSESDDSLVANRGFDLDHHDDMLMGGAGDLHDQEEMIIGPQPAAPCLIETTSTIIGGTVVSEGDLSSVADHDMLMGGAGDIHEQELSIGPQPVAPCLIETSSIVGTVVSVSAGGGSVADHDDMLMGGAGDMHQQEMIIGPHPVPVAPCLIETGPIVGGTVVSVSAGGLNVVVSTPSEILPTSHDEQQEQPTLPTNHPSGLEETSKTDALPDVNEVSVTETLPSNEQEQPVPPTNHPETLPSSHEQQEQPAPPPTNHPLEETSKSGDELPDNVTPASTIPSETTLPTTDADA